MPIFVLNLVRVLICISLISWAPSLRAQGSPTDPGFLGIAQASYLGYSTQGAGARATGMGGAFIAVADDATAASHNPAGLAQLRTFEASLVGSQRKADVLYTGAHPSGMVPNVDPADYSDSPFRGGTSRKLEFASFTMPGQWSGKNFALQVSYQDLYDVDQSFNNQTHVKFHASDVGNYPNGFPISDQQIITQTGGMKVLTLGAAMELSPRILAGVAWNRWRGDSTYTSNFQSTQPYGGFNYDLYECSGRFRKSDRFSGENFNLGLLWRYDPVQVGITCRTAFTANIDSSAVIQRQVDGSPFSPDTYASNFAVHWPSTLGIGISWRPASQGLVALDWSLTRWTRATIEAPGQPNNGQNFFQLNADQDPYSSPFRFPGAADAAAWHLGGEYLLFLGSKIMPLRTGFFIEPMPCRDPWTGEVRALKGFTLGTGIKSGQLSFDIAYKQARGSRQALVPVSPYYSVPRDFGTYYTTSLMAYGEAAKESITIHTIKASIIYQFKGEGLRAFFRNVFIGS